MSRDRIALLVSGLVVGLIFVFMIVSKERHLANGELLLFELGPRDPRSLMQGDYMVLRYAVIDDVLNKVDVQDPRRSDRHDIHAVITVGKDRVVSFARVLPDDKGARKLQANEREVVLRYKKRGYAVAVGSFLFQEGMRPKYQQARYGGLMRSSDGGLLLIGLYDKERRLIE